MNWPGRAQAAEPARQPGTENIWALLERVPDPEIPVLSVVDLGIVRHVEWEAAAGNPKILHVGITPTYSGCPATEMIHQSVRRALDAAGYTDALIEQVLAPPWSSDWLTEAGRQKLAAFGIAPPESAVGQPRHLLRAPASVTCPHCGSRVTKRVSEFGSTPCKAHYRCAACLEPFDYFKCL
ncbi:MAG TPA: 1,2-phenylacetyl-CoA epoxidase subunit PaaD [Steroidobacteraceae bacterium]|nr:1,2-phenylacetyl-CoA epoxidase subunit PaaD [Steroidobacteraceae bacterium]